MSKKEYLKKDARREQILSAAMDIALTDGYDKLTRDGVAERANVAAGQVNRIFNTMPQLKRAVMRSTVAQLEMNPTNQRLLLILATGLSYRETPALNAPQYLKQAALDLLMG